MKSRLVISKQKFKCPDSFFILVKEEAIRGWRVMIWEAGIMETIDAQTGSVNPIKLDLSFQIFFIICLSRSHGSLNKAFSS